MKRVMHVNKDEFESEGLWGYYLSKLGIAIDSEKAKEIRCVNFWYVEVTGENSDGKVIVKKEV